MTTRRIIVLAIVFVTLIGIGLTFMLSSGSHWTTLERKEWKDAAIAKIEARLKESPPPTTTTTTSPSGNWAAADRLTMKNGDWIVCESICNKQDARIADLFIGYGSDGEWYFSTYHFCVGRSSLMAEPPSASLAEFVQRYALRSFDGRSDLALQPTWTAAR